MSIFSRLFRSPDERRINRLGEESRRKAAQIVAPLEALAKTIILTSEKCRDGVKPWMLASNEQDRQQMEVFAFYEFVYFFLHLTMRHACRAMTENECTHLGKHLLRGVASVSVDGTFENMTDVLRKRMIAEFCTNLQAAELQYAKCAPGDIYSESEEEGRQTIAALCMMLARNVATTIGRKNDSEVKSEILTLALAQLGHLDLLSLVIDFKRDSMELSDDYLDR